MRLIGIDYGKARIGLAMSDDLGMFAHPLETIHCKATPDPEKRIAEIVRERAVTTIVVGLPLRMDGTEGTAVALVRAFIERLRKELSPGIEIVTLDERLSTVAARQNLHASGRNIRKSRPFIDQVAACVILQDYIDSLSLGCDSEG